MQKFHGNPNQIRFHPIMINLATNICAGMKLEDFKDFCPMFFPTIRTVQRGRAKVATREGSDPKVYARVPEMLGFSTEEDMFVHWIFDEVKLTSGLVWNARNDDFRGLCCGKTGSVEDLKDLLEDLVFDTTPTTKDDSNSDGIYCNQWLARNPYGTTLVAEFFYNDGNLNGNEVMRQFLQVSTSAALVGLKTVGLVSDMGGSNDRFYSYLRDGKTIDVTNEWPIDQVVVQNPINPNTPQGKCTHGQVKC